MSLKRFLLEGFVIGRKTLADVKTEADQSQKELDHKIQETRASSRAVVIRAREEVKHSERIIKLAEQAVRAMRQVEKHH